MKKAKHSTKLVKNYLIAAAFMITIDLVWLGVIIKDTMAGWLGDLLAPTTIVWSALLAWLLMPLGIVLLVDRVSSNIKESALYGAVYGLVLYGVYDFTNYAVIAGWPKIMLVVDILWGTALCTATAVFLRYVNRRWLG